MLWDLWIIKTICLYAFTGICHRAKGEKTISRKSLRDSLKFMADVEVHVPL